jgi:hypothetical protein
VVPQRRRAGLVLVVAPHLSFHGIFSPCSMLAMLRMDGGHPSKPVMATHQKDCQATGTIVFYS